MKLLLFLLAVYALIFHQYQKIERSKTFPVPFKEINKTKLDEAVELPQQENYVNADRLVRGSYLIYRHSPEAARFYR